jgi:ElaB/YqjD/DUF883 family membrane-anchored ribosome-binding protein
MSKAKEKDLYGYLGAESLALREQIERLTAAIEQAAKTEGADAVKAAAEAAREILERGRVALDELSGKAEAAKAVSAEGRQQLESLIRDKPLAAVSMAAAAGFLFALLVRR